MNESDPATIGKVLAVGLLICFVLWLLFGEKKK
jgi:hypothetical protein